MSLAAGSTLGPYEVIGPLGAGGMGEVYRARDGRLGRVVAIKVLPEALAGDPERRARFEREARTVAALSHPNILSIHDFGSDAGVLYAVMELLEGETLRERLLGGALGISRGLELAVQVAHGLAAAHGKGVVHRDLKPENVILTWDGRVKILDFGLARQEAPAGGDPARATASAAFATEAGVVLGTVGYMSPEQLHGQPVDARADIFALGALLYEALSARRAFLGASPVEIMSAVLREDPPALSGLVPQVPPALERLIVRCLEKRPEARFQSAADLAFVLGTISGSGRHDAPARVWDAQAGAARFQRLTFRIGAISGARFTPDGHSVVYGAAWEGKPFEVYTSRPDGPQSRSFGLPPADLFAISAGGEMALSLGHRHSFWQEASGTLARASLAGGGVRLLLEDVEQADWGPDGKSLAVVRRVAGLARLEYPLGRILYETAGWLSHPRVARDGSCVAFADYPTRGDTTGSVRVAGADGRPAARTPLLTNLGGLAWSPSGDEVWFSGIDEQLQCGIWAVDAGGSRRRLYASGGRVKLHDVTASGRVLASLQSLRIGANVGSASGQSETNLSWFDGSMVADLSPEGRALLFSEAHEADNPHYGAYLRPLDGSPAVRLGDGVATRLSPDGAWALTLGMTESSLTMVPTGLGEERSLRAPEIERYLWAGWHPNQQQLFVVGRAAEKGQRLYLQGIAGGAPRALSDEQIDVLWVAGLPISPDGERVVARLMDGSAAALSVGTGKWQALHAIRPGDLPMRFDRSGRGLFVARPTDDPPRIEHLDLATGERTPWRTLRPPNPAGVLYVGAVTATAEGDPYAYSYVQLLSDLYLVEGLG